MATIISILQGKIDEKVQELAKTKKDLEERVELVASLEESTLAMVSGSGSTAQERRKVKTLDLRESLWQHREQIRAYEQAIAKLEGEIAEYEVQKRDSVAKYGYAAI